MLNRKRNVLRNGIKLNASLLTINTASIVRISALQIIAKKWLYEAIVFKSLDLFLFFAKKNPKTTQLKKPSQVK